MTAQMQGLTSADRNDADSGADARYGLLSATDAMIDDAVQYGDPMILRGLLYQLTGDEDIPAMEVVTRTEGGFPMTCLASDADASALMAKAATFLKAYRDQGAGDIGLGAPERLFDSMRLTAGEELPDSEREIWLEQTALNPWARGLNWEHPPSPEQLAKFKVAIIGAGLSGLNAAVQLKRAGIPYVVIEKNSEVGGTWYENQYPGARVDSPSRTYTHLFGADFTYPYAYCPADENLRYMRWVADNFAIRDNIFFNTEARSVIWDEAAQLWDITAVDPTGTQTWRVNAVISCVGFLSRANMPEIPGMESFEGISCHTAQWPQGLDVSGKRIAVIGSGASGYQTVPVIAKTAGHTILFQRTPSWCFENPSYVSKLPSQLLWLERNFPYFVNFSRLRLSALYGPDTARILARRDPGYEDPHAGSEPNKQSREARIGFIKRKLASRPELIDKMIPAAPPFSSRPIAIDSEDSIFDALTRDNVTLVSDPIEQITPGGIVAGNVDYPLDMIVYATGFKAQDFLWPMDVRGRGGVRIEDLWVKDGARAYIGSMLPGFPNFFMSYGPNTNNYGGFQIIDILEIEIRFALECIAGLIVQDKSTVEVTTDAYWRYNDELDREEGLMFYMDPRVRNYYRNSHGRSAVNLPIDFRRMWRWLRNPTGTALREADAGLKPYFGGDLLVN